MTTARANRPQQLFRAERQATVASGPAEVTRLSDLIARQRSELDSVRAQAAARSVTDLARGILMERLGCSLADATRQLAYLSEQSGTSLADLAAQIAGQPRQRAGNGGAPIRPMSLAEAAAEQAGDGAALAAALLDIALGAAGAVAVAIWVTAPDGGLELAGQAGFGDREAGRWRWVHPDMDSPIRHAARCGQETWWPHGRPEQDNSLMIGSWHGGANVVLPLREAGVHARVDGSVLARASRGLSRDATRPAPRPGRTVSASARRRPAGRRGRC